MTGKAGFSLGALWAGASARPSARPAKLLRPGNQTSLHRIVLDVATDPIELRVVSRYPIEILLLPKFLSALSQEPVGQKRRGAFDSPDQFGDRDSWGAQEMDVIRHDNVGVQSAETTNCHVPQLFLHQSRNLYLPRIERTSSRRIEHVVPGDKRFSGGEMFALEGALRGKASPQAPRQEDRSSGRVNVGQATAIGAHMNKCGRAAKILRPVCGAKASRRLKPALQ
jgi:hypothetical protein